MTSKNCSKCKKIKPLSGFGKRKATKDGYHCSCKDCHNKSQNHRLHTKNGLITQIYGGQRAASRIRNHDYPNYSLYVLRSWALNQDIFHALYNQWVNSNYNTNIKPSFDRIDDYKPYTLDNLQITTWDKNRAKSHSDRISGKNKKTGKSVIKMTLDGLFITKYYSIMQAERETGIFNTSISACCCGKLKSAGGFLWEHSKNKEN